LGFSDSIFNHFLRIKDGDSRSRKRFKKPGFPNSEGGLYFELKMGVSYLIEKGGRMDKMLRRSLVLVILFVGCLLTGGVEAAILEVGPSGYPYTLIQAGINAAVDGDTVLVHDGTYFENITFSGKAITVKSVNGAASTIIDANASGSVVTFSSGEGSGSVLDGFTILNGNGNWGGGFAASPPPRPSPTASSMEMQHTLGPGSVASPPPPRPSPTAASAEIQH
jgi:hypothetical protein